VSPLEYLIVAALVAYAIFKQTQTSEIRDTGTYKMALIYGAVGVGYAVKNSLSGSPLGLPEGPAGWGLALLGVALSVVIGTVRGYKTKVWMDAAGRRLRRGTPLTIALFLILLIAKIGIGIVAYAGGIHDGTGLSQIMIVVAIMIGFQTSIINRRARTLPVTGGRTSAPRIVR
jgi:hypothetical protein